MHVVYVEEYPPYLSADHGSFAYLDAEALQTMLEPNVGARELEYRP